MSVANLFTNFSSGYYRDYLGDFYSPATASYFPGPNVSTGDPTVSFSSPPVLGSILGSWLSDPAEAISQDPWEPLSHTHIPSEWETNTETAIIYEIDGSLTGSNPLTGYFGADNGIFVWVNGEYKFGALAPGFAEPEEYKVDLGSLKSGKNYIQILREDHGRTTGFIVQILGEIDPGIFIESIPVADGYAFGYDHIYLVYRDINGEETVLSGGFTRDTFSLGIKGAGAPLMIEKSSESRFSETLVERGSRRLDLGGRNPAEVWDRMRQHAMRINEADLPYKALIGNSNSAIASILYSVGIDIKSNIPFNTKPSDLPGIDNLLVPPEKDAQGKDLVLSLANPQPGTIGLKRDETALVIDINRDGVIERSTDFVIQNFFQGNEAGPGFLKQVGNLNGNDILNANRQVLNVGTDFNGDRKADLVWRNTETGENIVWRLDGTTLIGSDSLVAVPSRNWVMGGTGDFNGDGKTDLAWRNNATGENVVWFMDGKTIAETGSFLTITDRNWVMGGTGDFNGDGKTDLAWRNYATGENAIWLMDGTNIAQAAFIQPVPDRNWVMSGAGDFNRDNKADLVWRNDATGENAIWLMNGTQLLSGNYFTAVKDSNWRIGQTGDFNQDGNTDIAWHNGASGLNAVWLMNGTQLDQGRFIAPLQGSSWNLINSRSPLT